MSKHTKSLEDAWFVSPTILNADITYGKRASFFKELFKHPTTSEVINSPV